MDVPTVTRTFNPTKVTCWLASEEGKSFGVQWKYEERRVTAAQGFVYVDGIRYGGTLVSSGVLGVNDISILAQHINYTTTRDLVFARVHLSDDDSLLNKEISKNLGEISLVIERGEMIRSRRRRPAGNRDLAVPADNERLHERCNSSLFGQGRVRIRTAYKWRLIRNSQPKMTFVFKCQSLGRLQLMPAGSQDGRAERTVGASDDHTIKTEEPRELRRPLFAPGEIIDLT
ncbi:hypothetical protein V8E55_003706 [Tylopilus felleus]